MFYQRIVDSDTIFENAAIHTNSYGTFLEVQARMLGTGNFNASDYFVYRKGGWKIIDAEQWLEDLQQRIPPDLEIRKGVWPDLALMTAEASLYQDVDPNCCPSGGTARVQLALVDDRFVLKSLDHACTPADCASSRF